MKFLKSTDMEVGIWNGGNHLSMKWPVVYEGKDFSVWYVSGWNAFVLQVGITGGASFLFGTLEAAIAKAIKEGKDK